MGFSWLLGFRDAERPPTLEIERETTSNSGLLFNNPNQNPQSFPHLSLLTQPKLTICLLEDNNDIESFQPATPSKNGIGKPSAMTSTCRVTTKSRQALFCSSNCTYHMCAQSPYFRVLLVLHVWSGQLVPCSFHWSNGTKSGGGGCFVYECKKACLAMSSLSNLGLSNNITTN